jgi:hypothetical protein
MPQISNQTHVICGFPESAAEILQAELNSAVVGIDPIAPKMSGL